MYGLRDLTAALLQCPGAVQAYGTANCDGDYPTNLAEKSGHWDLRDFMETYMEVAAMVDRDLANEGSLQTSQIMSDMVQGQYLSFGGDIGISEDSIYCRMEDAGKVNSLPLPSGYVHMKSLVDAPATSVDYDSMIEKMLKETLIEDNEKEYETMDFAPFPLPPRQRHEERVQLQDEAPPPPPPRDDKFPMKLKNDCEGSRPDDETILMLPKLPTNLSSAQEELIALQRKVKNNELTINQAVFRFKEWERKHKERAASFQYQQESLQRIRNSLMRGRERRKQEGKSTSIRISEPITVATSTYDKVLLKTRKEVMVENAYGGLEKIKEGKESSERIEPARTNLDNSTGNAYTVDAQSSFNRARSFKQRFGRPPMSLPDERTGSTLSRLGSQGSTNSSSSRSSNRSTGNFPFPSSFDSAQVAPPLPRGPRGSIPDRIQQPWPSDLHSQEVEPDSFRPHRGSFDAPPPIPPRDGPPARYGPGASRHHSIAGTLDARPDIPPRNPRYR